MAPLTRAELDRIAWRTLWLQATWNYERQQGLGFAYALEPALRRLYPDPDELRARLAEHTAYFNTQPTMASLCLGAVANLEEHRALAPPPSRETSPARTDLAELTESVAVRPALAPDPIPRVKAVMGSALAALGDRFFWLTLRPFAACLGALVALGGSWTGALVLWLCYNSVHLTVRFAGVRWGYREGPSVLGEPLRRRVGSLVHAYSVVGSALIGVIVAVLLVPGGDPESFVFQAAVAGGLALGLVTAQRARPSPTQWALGVGVLCLIVSWFR